MVCQRWPRDPDSKAWSELVGDLLEMALGCGYIDAPQYWRVIEAVSPVVLKIADIVQFIDCHGSFARTGTGSSFFRGAAAPYARKLSVSMYNAMIVQKFKIHDKQDCWIAFLEVATGNKLMYGLEPM